MVRFLIAALFNATMAVADSSAIPPDVAERMIAMLDQCGTQLDCLQNNEAEAYCGDAIGAGGAPSDWAQCQQITLDWWDGQLNAHYKTRMAAQVSLDQDAGDGDTRYQDMLRDMQRAWIPYRDARCQFGTYGGGSAGSGAVNSTLECLIQETAHQTVMLGGTGQG